MTTGSRCLICAHDRREEIETALIQGKSIASLERDHDVSRRTISRHRDNCIPQALARSRHADSLRRGDAIIEGAERLYQKAMAVLERAEQGAAHDKDAVLAGLSAEERMRVETLAGIVMASDDRILRSIREARPTLELLAKLSAQLRDAGGEPVMSVHELPGYEDFKNALLRALRPFPEAFASVSQAMIALQEEG